MKAIIVAGGFGKRLHPITLTVPKPMIEIGGKPLLLHKIENLKRHGITDIILALGYLPQSIKNFFGNGKKFGVKITYTFENPDEPRGTAGAIILARKFIKQTFIVSYADTLHDFDIKKMIIRHKNSEAIATIGTYKHRGSNYKSSLEFDRANTLKKFRELKESKNLDGKQYVWSNSSFYIFEPEIYTYIENFAADRVDFASDIFPALLEKEEVVKVFPIGGYFIDIGTMETLQKARRDSEVATILRP